MPFRTIRQWEAPELLATLKDLKGKEFFVYRDYKDENADWGYHKRFVVIDKEIETEVDDVNMYNHTESISMLTLLGNQYASVLSEGVWERVQILIDEGVLIVRRLAQWASVIEIADD